MQQYNFDVSPEHQGYGLTIDISPNILTLVWLGPSAPPPSLVIGHVSGRCTSGSRGGGLVLSGACQGGGVGLLSRIHADIYSLIQDPLAAISAIL